MCTPKKPEENPIHFKDRNSRKIKMERRMKPKVSVLEKPSEKGTYFGLEESKSCHNVELVEPRSGSPTKLSQNSFI